MFFLFLVLHGGMSVGAIDYTKIVNSAMHQVVREVLKAVSISKKCNLLISFSTKNKKVVIPEDLREHYPEKMSIILNNQFFDLVVSDRGFVVGLMFSGVKKKLSIPFSSMIYFCDRDVNFSIEFKGYDVADEDLMSSDLSILSEGLVHDFQGKVYRKGKIIYFDEFLKQTSSDTKDKI